MSLSPGAMKTADVSGNYKALSLKNGITNMTSYDFPQINSARGSSLEVQY